jgi:hypothetical protein
MDFGAPSPCLVFVCEALTTTDCRISEHTTIKWNTSAVDFKYHSNIHMVDVGLITLNLFENVIVKMFRLTKPDLKIPYFVVVSGLSTTNT